MVAVIRHLHPFGSHFFRLLRVLFSNVFFAQHICHVAVRSNTHDSLDRKIGIVRKVSGKVIRTELVLRVKTVLNQIIRPGCQSFPMLLCVVSISFYSSNRCSKDYHIAGFFDRHIASVSLTVSQRICTYVVSSKRFGPFSAFTIIEDMVHGSFHQFRIVKQKQRSSRISQIDCSDGTITEILFGKEYQVTIRSLYQFMGS